MFGVLFIEYDAYLEYNLSKKTMVYHTDVIVHNNLI